MRRALAVLLLLGVVGCDLGGSDERPEDESTLVVDPAPTEAGGGGYLEYGDTGAQPDLLPGGGAGRSATRIPIRVTEDGCRVRREDAKIAGLAWRVASARGVRSDAADGRLLFRPRIRGRATVSLVVIGRTASGMVGQQVSNQVRVRC